MPGANKILMNNSLGDLSEMRKGKGYSCKLATHNETTGSMNSITEIFLRGTSNIPASWRAAGG